MGVVAAVAAWGAIKRQSIDGVLFRTRTEIHRRDLPERLGPWTTVHAASSLFGGRLPRRMSVAIQPTVVAPRGESTGMSWTLIGKHPGAEPILKELHIPSMAPSQSRRPLPVVGW